MIGKAKSDGWERISAEKLDEGAISVVLGTSRLPVPGGWIYRTIMVTATEIGSEALPAVSTVFVPFARYTGAEMEGRLATSPHAPVREPSKAEGGIPDFSQPVPRRDR